MNDLKTAMKAGDADRLLLLRGLTAAIKNAEIQKKTSGKSEPLTEEEILQVLQREAKKRKEASQLMKTGGREDLAAKEEKELKFLEEYLPQQMGEEEIKAVIERIYSSGVTDFNSLIKESMKELKGKADGQVVSKLVKEKTG